ncbi:MAG: InlB B-repeat-containing protein [Candidatus Bathyarchaeota archaeon]|nr:InlB B-repeat-containing protein [Candidatus Termiticorpusculum sp.]
MKNKNIQKIFSFTLAILMMLALILPVMTSFAWATDEETSDSIDVLEASTITEETVVLEQTFYGLTTLPNGWTAHTGTWGISDGKLHQSQDLAIGEGPALITFGEDLEYLENFRFEATIQLKDAPLFWSIMGVSFDVQGSYPLTFAGFYRDTSQGTGVQFGRYISGPYLSLDSFGSSSKELNDGETHRVKVEVFGEYGDIYFDDVLVLPNAEITRQNGGSFGLIMCYGGIGYYDNIKITALPYRLPFITSEKNLLDGTVGLPYLQRLVSEGDKIIWSKVSGNIPDGLDLSSANGVISGTPTTSGIFTFTVKAENVKDSDIKDFSIAINAVYVSSFVGSGVDFSFGDVELVSTNKLVASPKTFEAWVKMPTNSQTIGVIAGNGAIDGFNGLATINFGVTSQGNPWLYWKETSGNEANYTAYANVKLGDWVHVAIVQDNENHKIACYINGDKADEQTFAIMEDTIPVRPLKLGGDYLWGNVKCFPGEIADIRIWSSVRTQLEIQANMNDLLTGVEEGLLANWLLNGKINGVYKDTSTQGNDARVWNEWLEPEFAQGDYTIAVIPDIQFLTLYYQDVLNALFNWLQDNAHARNMQFVIQVGDITDKNTVVEWQLVKDNFAKLDNVVSYVFVPGNHDYNGMPADRDTGLFNSYLPYSIYSQTSIFGGAYESDKLDNAYYYFTTDDDVNYMMLCLEMVPRNSVLDWANEVVVANSDCRVIVVTHSYLSSDGTYETSSGYDPNGNGGQAIWDKLVSQHANIIMVLCGHIHYDDLVMRVDAGVYGNAVPQLLVDAQDMDYWQGGVGMVALLTFSNNGRDVAVNWYSVKEDKLFRDWNQFTFSIELGTHTITFDTQGGNNVPAQIIEHGSLLSEPTPPTRSGYIFTGWLYGENSFNFNTRITTDITLTANWEEIKPTITSVTPTASVKQLNGNKNDLTITITEKLSDGTSNILSQTFSINNNAADTYTIGTYRVYVDTKGNTQIRACYII